MPDERPIPDDPSTAGEPSTTDDASTTDETSIPDGTPTFSVEDLADLIMDLCGIYRTQFDVNGFGIELKAADVEEGARSFSVYVLVHWLDPSGKSILHNVERCSFRLDEFAALTNQKCVEVFRERLRSVYERCVVMVCFAILRQPWAEPVISELGLVMPVQDAIASREVPPTESPVVVLKNAVEVPAGRSST